MVLYMYTVSGGTVQSTSKKKSVAACMRQHEVTLKSSNWLSITIMIPHLPVQCWIAICLPLSKTQCYWYLLRSVLYSHNYNISSDCSIAHNFVHTQYQHVHSTWCFKIFHCLWSCRKLLCSAWLYISIATLVHPNGAAPEGTLHT